MRHIAVLALAAGAVLAVGMAACSSGSTSPSPGPFTGTYTSAWFGESSVADTLRLTQSGHVLNGIDVEHVPPYTFTAQFTGTVRADSVFLGVKGDTTTLYKGTFTSPAVVSGYWYYDSSDSTGLVWTRE
jgi:hypothetical protein